MKIVCTADEFEKLLSEHLDAVKLVQEDGERIFFKTTFYGIPLHIEEKKVARDKGLHAGVYSANAMYTAALLFELHDTLGWGQTRLKRIHERVQKLFESIADHTVNYAEIAEVLRDECEINLVIERPDDTAVDALDMFLTMADADRKAHAVRIR